MWQGSKYQCGWQLLDAGVKDLKEISISLEEVREAMNEF